MTIVGVGLNVIVGEGLKEAPTVIVFVGVGEVVGVGEKVSVCVMVVVCVRVGVTVLAQGVCCVVKIAATAVEKLLSNGTCVAAVLGVAYGI